ncbi:Tmh18 protein [Martiniozyma asiatica (nom. inval.)]|nr:Tmh18 protein [Martiniozyma asiatica]
MSLPLHLLSYTYAAGSVFHNSYVTAPLSIKVLPRRQFGELQATLLPLQAAVETISPAIIAITAPYVLSTAGIALLLSSSACGLANWALIGPKCAEIKQKRWMVIDSAYNGDEAKAKESGDLKQIDAKFGKWHGASMVVNLGSVIGLVGYAFVLARKLKPL